MKSNSAVQFQELQAIAEQKLAELKPRVSAREFERLVSIVVAQIGRDMGINSMEDPLATSLLLLEVDDPDDFGILEKSVAPLHLLIKSDDLIGNLREFLSERERRKLIFSLFFCSRGDHVASFAASLDDIPVFMVSDREEAISILGRFRSSPFEVVCEAVNGMQVSIRYLEGSPT